MTDDTAFARLVSLACHDVRTPLATAYGFARTLERTLSDPELRYATMVASAASEVGEIIDLLSLVSRIETGRWAPDPTEVSTDELASAAAERAQKDDGSVQVTGAGATVRVALPAAELALAGFARCALRHGGLERVELVSNRLVIELRGSA